MSCDCPNPKTRQWGRWNWTWRWSCLRWVSEWLVPFMANDVNMCETRTHAGRPLRCQVFSVPGKLSNHVDSCFQHFPKALQGMRSFESQDFAQQSLPIDAARPNYFLKSRMLLAFRLCTTSGFLGEALTFSRFGVGWFGLNEYNSTERNH